MKTYTLTEEDLSGLIDYYMSTAQGSSLIPLVVFDGISAEAMASIRAIANKAFFESHEIYENLSPEAKQAISDHEERYE